MFKLSSFIFTPLWIRIRKDILGILDSYPHESLCGSETLDCKIAGLFSVINYLCCVRIRIIFKHFLIICYSVRVVTSPTTTEPVASPSTAPSSRMRISSSSTPDPVGCRKIGVFMLARLWIRIIHFLANPVYPFFSMRIWMQLFKTAVYKLR